MHIWPNYQALLIRAIRRRGCTAGGAADGFAAIRSRNYLMRVNKRLKCSRQVLSIHNGASYPCQMALGYRRCSVGFALAPWPLAGTDDVSIDIVGLGTFTEIGQTGSFACVAITSASPSRHHVQVVTAARPTLGHAVQRAWCAAQLTALWPAWQAPSRGLPPDAVAP